MDIPCKCGKSIYVLYYRSHLLSKYHLQRIELIKETNEKKLLEQIKILKSVCEVEDINIQNRILNVISKSNEKKIHEKFKIVKSINKVEDKNLQKFIYIKMFKIIDNIYDEKLNEQIKILKSIDKVEDKNIQISMLKIFNKTN